MSTKKRAEHIAALEECIEIAEWSAPSTCEADVENDVPLCGDHMCRSHGCLFNKIERARAAVAYLSTEKKP